jgi:hypothetical protein
VSWSECTVRGHQPSNACAACPWIRFRYEPVPAAGIIKNMWQSLKMRTMFHRDQKIRDCYVAFILHNLKLESRDTFDWGYAEPDEESPALAADTDVEAKLRGDHFRNNLINQMWVDRAERKAAAAAHVA